MKKQILYSFLFICSTCTLNLVAQVSEFNKDTLKVSKLFRNQDKLALKLSISVKDIKKETNDSTYIITKLAYLGDTGSWSELDTEIRVRGNFRLNNCYFPPLKLKTGKEERKGTIFKSNKKLKLVVPCASGKSNNDYVIKEYLAYKLYEIISPYHYKTRLVDLTFNDLKGKNIKTYQQKAFLIEDIDKIAERYSGKVMERSMHPMNQNALSSVQNAFFQFMIGNTDFSTAYQHNEKLLFINNEIIPVPYDFDMSGLVNTNYSVVSAINEENLNLDSVRDRLYRGFKRDQKIILQVRQEFLANGPNFYTILDGLKSEFDDPKDFAESKEYLMQFFNILSDDKKFNKEITQRLRTK